MITAVTQTGDTATVSSYKKLSIGARIKFLSSYGIVNQVYNSSTYGVKLSNSDPISTGTVLTWWKIAQASFKIHVPQKFFVGMQNGSLCAQCVTSRQGPIEWKLFAGSKLILSGNDLLSPGYCKAEIKGAFPAGSYRIQVCQYIERSPIKQIERYWTLVEPASNLEWGMGKAAPAINLT